MQACKWTNLPVPNAPYVTDPDWLDLYGCKYVVHGDDITTGVQTPLQLLSFQADDHFLRFIG